MRALIIEKLISTRGYFSVPAKLTQRTHPAIWPRLTGRMLIVSPMFGIKEKMPVDLLMLKLLAITPPLRA